MLLEANANPFHQLVTPAYRARFISTVLSVVERSFQTHPMAHRTAAEEKRRCEIAFRAFAAFVRDKRWSVDQALNSVRGALEASLNTEAFNPRTTTLYAVEPGMGYLQDAASLKGS
jgi:hypothetical protein